MPISLGKFCEATGLHKSAASEALKAYRTELATAGYSEADIEPYVAKPGDLSPLAQDYLLKHFGKEAAPITPEVQVFDAPGHLSSGGGELLTLPGFGGDLAFNVADLIGSTNGTPATVAVLGHAADIATAIRQGVQAATAKAQAEADQVSRAAQQTMDAVRELELTLAEARAVTAAANMLKGEKIREAQAAQEKLQAMQAINGEG